MANHIPPQGLQYRIKMRNNRNQNVLICYLSAYFVRQMEKYFFFSNNIENLCNDRVYSAHQNADLANGLDLVHRFVHQRCQPILSEEMQSLQRHAVNPLGGPVRNCRLRAFGCEQSDERGHGIQ